MDLGWWATQTGGKHEKWTNGNETLSVPRHREVPEGTVRSILKDAMRSSPKEGKPDDI